MTHSFALSHSDIQPLLLIMLYYWWNGFIHGTLSLCLCVILSSVSAEYKTLANSGPYRPPLSPSFHPTYSFLITVQLLESPQLESSWWLQEENFLKPRLKDNLWMCKNLLLLSPPLRTEWNLTSQTIKKKRPWFFLYAQLVSHAVWLKAESLLLQCGRCSQETISACWGGWEVWVDLFGNTNLNCAVVNINDARFFSEAWILPREGRG